RGLRRGIGSPERLGAGSEQPAPEVLAAAPCAPWRHAARPPVRRGHGGPRGAGARAGVQRDGRAAAWLLTADSARSRPRRSKARAAAVEPWGAGGRLPFG